MLPFFQDGFQNTSTVEGISNFSEDISTKDSSIKVLCSNNNWVIDNTTIGIPTKDISSKDISPERPTPRDNSQSERKVTLTNISPKGKEILQSDSLSNDISPKEAISSATLALGICKNGLTGKTLQLQICQKSECVAKTIDSKLHFDAIESSRMLDQDSIPTHQTTLMSLQHQQQIEHQAVSPVENQRGV